MIKAITILGSTGSIGTNTLDVVSRNRDAYRIKAITANSDVDTLYQQCLEWLPDYAVMRDEEAAQKLNDRLKITGSKTEVLAGIDNLIKVAILEEVQIVVAGIVGAAGLLPTYAAVKAGKRILLANKEALVMSGKVFMEAVRESGAELLPVDSEHNAIFQCMPENITSVSVQSGVTKILLTASGGPFRTLPIDQLAKVSPEQAINHPNWEMGHKISVDSATMMNKGLEVIEARWLFDVSPDDIKVIIHPQSIIHSMVSYRDGSVLAQLGNPDMRTPIAYALAWPERIDSGVEPLDIIEVATLGFEEPDSNRYPCLSLCYKALEKGAAACITLNAANEIAVAAFLDRKLPFTAIAEMIEETLLNVSLDENIDDLDKIISVDRNARRITNECIARGAY